MFGSPTHSVRAFSSHKLESYSKPGASKYEQASRIPNESITTSQQMKPNTQPWLPHLHEDQTRKPSSRPLLATTALSSVPITTSTQTNPWLREQRPIRKLAYWWARPRGLT